MSLTLALTLLAMPALIQQGQSVPVERGDRLAVSNLDGVVSIRSGTRDVVTFEARSGTSDLGLERSGQVVRVQARRPHGRPTARIDITVPSWMPVSVSGINLAVSIEGVEANIRVECVNGQVDVRGGRGNLELGSISGPVILRGGSGRIMLRSVNGEIKASDIEGEISAETTNGGIHIEGARATAVSAGSVNGGVTYQGSIAPDGRYQFTTHNGNLELVIPDDASATVSVSTYHGEFLSDFPVVLSEGRLGTRFRFVLRRGGATIDLESFQGRIRLRRTAVSGRP